MTVEGESGARFEKACFCQSLGFRPGGCSGSENCCVVEERSSGSTAYLGGPIAEHGVLAMEW